MASRSHPDKMNPQIYEEAGDWLVRNREQDLDEAAKRAFDLWLRSSPEHIRAYLELTALWEDVGQVKASSAAAELIEGARSEGNVVHLEDDRRPALTGALDDRAPASHAKIRSRGLRRPVALAASLAVLCSAVALAAWMGRDPRYSTGVAEQRLIVLADGSTVELNARSRIRIRYSEHQRSVELLEGQALFDVAKDPARPFIVSADRARVRAVGTQFDVQRRRADTVVTVLEGRVAVAPTSAVLESHGARAGSRADSESRAGRSARVPDRPEPILLSAGQQLTVTQERISAPLEANVEAVTAWTRRRFVFNDSPLTHVADEFNRFNARRLVIDDHELESFRISGVFSSSDLELLLRFLRTQPDIEVVETDQVIRISRK